MTFYEGAEKKVDVTVSATMPSLRSLGYDYWSGVVGKCNASILSHISNEQVDAYLLSESSLFVWDKRFIIITCGQTVLVNSLLHFITTYGADCIESVLFQRENEMRPDEQATTFTRDCELIKEFIEDATTSTTHRGLNNTIFCYGSTIHHREQGTELQLRGLQSFHAEQLATGSLNSQQIREILKLNSFFSEMRWDDHLFTPCGYSFNGLDKDSFLTIHITPQPEASLISIKSNIVSPLFTEFQNQLITLFEPGSTIISSFNDNDIPVFKQGQLTETQSCEVRAGFTLTQQAWDMTALQLLEGQR